MSFFSFNNIELAGMATAVPKNKVTVDSFKDVFGENTVEKMKLNVGVEEYRKSTEKQTASDLGFAAAEQLLSKTGIDRSQIGILTFVSLSPDYLRPATACVLQDKLKLSKDCAAFDVGMGCSGFIYGMQIASSMLQGSDSEWALLIATDAASKLIAPKDQSTVMLVGDAGTATLLHKTKGKGIKGLLGTDGSFFDAAIVPAGGFRNRTIPRDKYAPDYDFQKSYYDYFMNGLDVFSFSMSEIPKAIQLFCEKTKVSIDKYDSVILHQANLMIIKQLIKKLSISEEKTPISLRKFGNTSSACIPLTICDNFAGKQEELNLIACGFGTGLSYGVTSFSIDAKNICEIIETDYYYEDDLIK